jgi:kinesin family protein 6/9
MIRDKQVVVCCRQSKLTAALRDAIGGNSNTVMIANLWPEEAHLEECVSTLRFAARVRCLQTDAQINESADPLLALKKAERQIKELRQELAMRDMLSGRGRIVYEDISDGERLELQQLVLRYLSGSAELDQLPTDSLKRIRETYKAFKAVSSSWAEAAAQGDPARASNHSAPGTVSSLCHHCCKLGGC